MFVCESKAEIEHVSALCISGEVLRCRLASRTQQALRRLAIETSTQQDR